MARSKLIRVHNEFMELVKRIEQDYDEPSIVEATKHIARDYSDIYFTKSEKLAKSKKAMIPDILLLIIFMFMFILIIIVAYKFINSYNTQIQASDIMTSQGKSIISNFQSRFINIFDFIWVFVFVFLVIGIGYGAYYLDLPPIFYLIAIFFIIFALILAASLSNTFSNFEDNLDVARDTAGNPVFTLSGFILDNYVSFVLVMAFIVFIVGFAKFRQVNG